MQRFSVPLPAVGDVLALLLLSSEVHTAMTLLLLPVGAFPDLSPEIVVSWPLNLNLFDSYFVQNEKS